MICEEFPHGKKAMKVREKCAYMSFPNDLIQCTIHFAESAVDTLVKVRLVVCHSAVREERDFSVVVLSASGSREVCWTS